MTLFIKPRDLGKVTGKMNEKVVGWLMFTPIPAGERRPQRSEEKIFVSEEAAATYLTAKVLAAGWELAPPPVDQPAQPKPVELCDRCGRPREVCRDEFDQAAERRDARTAEAVADAEQGRRQEKDRQLYLKRRARDRAKDGFSLKSLPAADAS